MMKVSEIKAWLNTLNDDDFVGIDDDCLSLELNKNKNVYFDIGGIPLETKLEDHQNLNKRLNKGT